MMVVTINGKTFVISHEPWESDDECDHEWCNVNFDNDGKSYGVGEIVRALDDRITTYGTPMPEGDIEVFSCQGDYPDTQAFAELTCGTEDSDSEAFIVVVDQVHAAVKEYGRRIAAEREVK